MRPLNLQRRRWNGLRPQKQRQPQWLRSSKGRFYYPATTFGRNFIPRCATICELFSHKANGEKAHKYRLYRHLQSYIGLGQKVI